MLGLVRGPVRRGRSRETRLALSPRKWLGIFWLWLTLATVLGHAIAPVGSPIARTSGSAFSVSTDDVALGAARAEPPAKIKRVQDGAGDEFTAAGDLAMLPVAVAAAPIDAAARLSFAAPESALPASTAYSSRRARAPPRA